MNWTLKILATLAVAAAVVVAAVWLGGFGKSTPAPQSAPAPPPETQPIRTNRSGLFTRPPRLRSTRTNLAPAQISSSETNLIASGEEAIDEVLRGEGEASDKAKKLLELFPQLPAESQVEAVTHVANLIADADYAPLGRHLADTNTPPEVQDVILADLLGRPNALKLPWLLEVARTPAHEKAGEAKELLELYLEKDYGDDWQAWQNNLAQWLRDNPD